MKRFIDAGRMAIQSDILYCGLSLALTIPDICGSLEDPGPNKSQKRYLSWFKRWSEPRFTFEIGPQLEKTTFISAEDCYQLRCSLIHSGIPILDPKKSKNIGHFLFFDKTSGSHMNSINNGSDRFIQLRVDKFCEEIFVAAEEWDKFVESDPIIQERKRSLLTIHSAEHVYGGNMIKFG